MSKSKKKKAFDAFSYYPLADALNMTLDFRDNGVYGQCKVKMRMGDAGSIKVTPTIMSSVVDDEGTTGLLLKVLGHLGLYVIYTLPDKDVFLYVVDLQNVPNGGHSYLEDGRVRNAMEGFGMLHDCIKGAYMGRDHRPWKKVTVEESLKALVGDDGSSVE